MYTFRTISDNEAAALEAALIVAQKEGNESVARMLYGYINEGFESIAWGYVEEISDLVIEGKRLQNALQSVCRKLYKNEDVRAD